MDYCLCILQVEKSKQRNKKIEKQQQHKTSINYDNQLTQGL